MAKQPGRPRGLSLVTVLVLLLIGGGIWWTGSYGGAYWDNITIKADLHEAANLCMKVRDDGQVRDFIIRKLSQYQNLTVQPEDVQIERTNDNKYVTIDLAYSRTVTPLLIGGERTVAFSRHVEQDLSPVKW